MESAAGRPRSAAGFPRPFYALRQSAPAAVRRGVFLFDSEKRSTMGPRCQCPDCGKPMKYLAQIQWDTVLDGTEGTLCIEVCPDCRIVSMEHQQT